MPAVTYSHALESQWPLQGKLQALNKTPLTAFVCQDEEGPLVRKDYHADGGS
jgi:hypothetical protein